MPARDLAGVQARSENDGTISNGCGDYQRDGSVSALLPPQNVKLKARADHVVEYERIVLAVH